MRVRNCVDFIFLVPSVARAFVYFRTPSSFRSSELTAEGGAPKYEKMDAKLLKSEFVGEGSVMLHIGKGDDADDQVLDYKPGNVLALEIEKPASSTLNEKSTQDADQNGGWVRGPYTVSRATDKTIDVLIKIVGDKSKIMASAEPGTPFKFGGKFHVPIYDGINKDDTKRVVLISTGVGIGPCIGAIEEMLADDDFATKIDLVASFRTDAEIICKDYLDTLSMNDDQFNWTPIVTSEMGRISDSDGNMEIVTASSDNTAFCSLTETHYHLIGNGQLVNEWKEGLAKAGVPEGKVTIESYFNHKAEIDAGRIDRIAKAISECAVSAQIA